MKRTTLALLLALPLAFISCSKDDCHDPCMGRPKTNQICTQQYDPVCGCNGQTYGNACEADAAGVRTWTTGPCGNRPKPQNQ